MTGLAMSANSRITWSERLSWESGPNLLLEYLPPQLRGEAAPRPIRHRSGGADFSGLTVELRSPGHPGRGSSANDLHERIVGQVDAN